MNLLDAVIVLGLVSFFAIRASMSAVYYALLTGGAFVGYIFGLALAGPVAGHVESALTKGLTALGLMLGLAAIGTACGRQIGKRAKMRLIMSRSFRTDKLLAWPCKIVAALLAIILLSQTLMYIPILGVQFEAQGSTVLTASNKLVQSEPLNRLAARIDPGQFHNLHLAYDSNPLTYNNISGAGRFQAAIDRAAPSIVKISGRTCVGLGFGSGFVAAPGLVVTNAHVISGASSIYISDHNGAYPATPLVIDTTYDIAVLYSRFITDPPLRFGAQSPMVGDSSITLGYPYAGDLQFFRGTILNKHYHSSHNALSAENTLVLSSSLGPGSSGGPVLNQNGEVVGVNDAGVGAGGGGNLIAIQGRIAQRLVKKAKAKVWPSSTKFCDVPPHFY